MKRIAHAFAGLLLCLVSYSASAVTTTVSATWPPGQVQTKTTNITGPANGQQTSFTGSSGPWNYVLMPFTVNVTGVYTATSSTTHVLNTTWFLNGLFTPNNATLVTPLSQFIVAVLSAGVTPPVTGTATGTFTGMTFTAGQQYSVLVAFNSGSVSGDLATVSITGPGCVNIGSSTCNSFTGTTGTGSGTATVSFTGGGATCTFDPSSAFFIPLTGAAKSPPAGSAPKDVSFPHGLLDFTLTGCTAGSTVTFTVTYPTALDPGTRYYKYGPAPGNSTPHWYVLPASASGNTVTFSITDGGLGDDDLTANGSIVDQGGPGSGGSSIPTLSQWMLFLLAASMMAAVPLLASRRARMNRG